MSGLHSTEQLDLRSAKGSPRRYKTVINRRRAQILLGWLWILDGLLQCEPANFARGYPMGDLAQSAMGQPRIVGESIFWLIGPFVGRWPLWNTMAAAVEVVIGIWLLRRRTVKLGLGISFIWALVVWWVGEGFGSLATGFATMLSGAPGAAILYVLVGLLAWPRDQQKEINRRHWAAVWVLVWVGSAIVQLGSPYPSAFVIRANLSEVASGQPAFLHAATYWLYSLAGRQGGLLDAGLVLVELAIGLGVLVPGLEAPCIVLAVVFAGSTWVVGQDLGDVLSAGATDPGSGPLLALLSLAGWQARPLSRASRALLLGCGVPDLSMATRRPAPEEAASLSSPIGTGATTM